MSSLEVGASGRETEREGLWRWEVGGGQWGRCPGDGEKRELRFLLLFFVEVFFSRVFLVHNAYRV